MAHLLSIAEMKNPKEYAKPIAAAMGLLNVVYIIVALVVYRYCGSEYLLPEASLLP